MIKIDVTQGDITKVPVDAIVNAANISLLGGGGVDGAIHRAAGPRLTLAGLAMGGCKTGDAKISGSFNIRTTKHIIHTVGPMYRKGAAEKSAELLASCYRKSLDLAKNLETIAFPAISTGIYGYPLEDATKVAVATIRQWAEDNQDSTLTTVHLMAFNQDDFATIKSIASQPV